MFVTKAQCVNCEKKSEAIKQQQPLLRGGSAVKPDTPSELSNGNEGLAGGQIMAYGSMPYVGMAPKKKDRHIKSAQMTGSKCQR